MEQVIRTCLIFVVLTALAGACAGTCDIQNCTIVGETCTSNGMAGVCQLDQFENLTMNGIFNFSGASHYHYFGREMSMSRDGQRVAVAASTLSDTQPNTVLIYELDGGEYVHVQTIGCDSLGAQANPILFGKKVALSKCNGSVLLVSTTVGTAVFEHDGTQYALFQKIGEDGDVGRSFDLSADGARLVLGAPKVNEIYVYERDTSEYVMTMRMDNNTIGISERILFGGDVQCDELCETVSTTAVAEMHNMTCPGSVYVFLNVSRDDTFRKLTAMDKMNGQYARGTALDSTGAYIAVSAYNRTRSTVEIRKYDNGTQQYNLTDVVQDFSSARAGVFGTVLRMMDKGQSLLVGNPQYVHDDAMYEYENSGDQFTRIGEYKVPAGMQWPTVEDEFSSSICANAAFDRVIVGSPNYRHQGRIFSYSRQAPLFCQVI